MTRDAHPDFEIVLPATSANLGPAFDAAAIAVKLHLRVEASQAGAFHIRAAGRDADICSQTDRNLILATYREILEQNGRDVVPLDLKIENTIPIGKGLGSSAAARLAGIALAAHFGGLGWDSEKCLDEGAHRERHGDNAAACWLGGFVVVRSASATAAKWHAFKAHKLAVRAGWPLLIAIPGEALPTEQARSILPALYSRVDVVANVQSAMLLASAFLEGNAEMLRDALHDRIHEPYRSSLCPLLEPLRALAGSEGVLGAALSGAGPSVLVVLDPAGNAEATREKIGRHLAERGLSAELLLTSMEDRGAADRRRVIRRSAAYVSKE